MSKSKNYTKAQIKFLMNQKKKGLTYREIAKEFGKKFGIRKTATALQEAFRRYRDDYDLDGLKTNVEIKAEVMIDGMIKEFINLVATRKYVPIQTEYVSCTEYSTDQIKRYFGSFQELEKQAKEVGPKRVFKDIINETSFTDKAFKALREDVAKYKRFVITTAVTGCAPHEDGLNALKSYCKKNKAKLLVLACSDPAHTRTHKYEYPLDHRFSMDSIVFRDLALNSNLFLSTIKLSAKQINPLTGLHSIAQNKGSFIFASPKQDLEHVAHSNKKGIPRALMTTGAITVSDYNTQLYLSERTATIADQHHKLGAIVVEVKNSKIFFARRIQIDAKTGAFTDINKQYFPDGTVKKVNAKLLQLGDYHVGSTDPKAKAASKEIAAATKPKFLTVEDFFDGLSINHHEKRMIALRALKAIRGELSLKRELEMGRDELNDLCSWDVEKIILKYGNHEDFLKRWLNECGYKDDPLNHYEGVCLTKAMMEGELPLEHVWTERYPIDDQNKVIFLKVNDSFMVDGIENGAHGHLGPSGSRNPNPAGVMKAYGPSNVGHNHSGAIFKDVSRAGTLTYLQLSYNDGPSAWTQSNTLQHEDGSRQLITIINGEWCLPDILK